METRPFIGLDNPIFAGRVRNYTSRPSRYERRPAQRGMINDVVERRLKPKPPEAQMPSEVRTAHHLNRKVDRTHVLRREIVAKPSRRQSAKLITTSRMLMTFAVVLFVCGMGVVLQTLRQNHQTVGQIKALAKQAGTSSQGNPVVPVAAKPATNSLNDYHVAADLPRLLTISKLGVKARVKRLGINADNSLQVPSNIYDTGWYDGSAKPGESGTMLLDGHVHGPTDPGVFMNLKKMTAGDVIQVERGDGTSFSYKVVKSRAYDVNNVDMAAALTSAVPGKAGLNLMTCDGKYDSKTKEYQQRLVVFAVQV